MPNVTVYVDAKPSVAVSVLPGAVLSVHEPLFSQFALRPSFQVSLPASTFVARFQRTMHAVQTIRRANRERNMKELRLKKIFVGLAQPNSTSLGAGRRVAGARINAQRLHCKKAKI